MQSAHHGIHAFGGLLLPLLLMVSPGLGETVDRPTSEELMAGKVDTGRTIELAVIVDVSPERLFELWSTAKGVESFFGRQGRIEPRVGGLYEIRFGPRPDGELAGPRGTRILRLELDGPPGPIGARLLIQIGDQLQEMIVGVPEEHGRRALLVGR